jgi:hypothetical protein
LIDSKNWHIFNVGITSGKGQLMGKFDQDSHPSKNQCMHLLMTWRRILRAKVINCNIVYIYRLDAKSSRGMIYENEELRIRTININAEVERGKQIVTCALDKSSKVAFFLSTPHKGQSEIKTLKREREQLRREIWTLRDEYDKLENLLRVKGIDPDEFLNSNQERNDNVEEDNLSDCSECSCESCCCDEECNEKSDQTLERNNENVNNTEAGGSSVDSPSSSSSSASGASTSHAEEHSKRVGKDRLNVNIF